MDIPDSFGNSGKRPSLKKNSTQATSTGKKSEGDDSLWESYQDAVYGSYPLCFPLPGNTKTEPAASTSAGGKGEVIPPAGLAVPSKKNRTGPQATTTGSRRVDKSREMPRRKKRGTTLNVTSMSAGDTSRKAAKRNKKRTFPASTGRTPATTTAVSQAVPQPRVTEGKPPGVMEQPGNQAGKVTVKVAAEESATTGLGPIQETEILSDRMSEFFDARGRAAIALYDRSTISQGKKKASALQDNEGTVGQPVPITQQTGSGSSGSGATMLEGSGEANTSGASVVPNNTQATTIVGGSGVHSGGTIVDLSPVTIGNSNLESPPQAPTAVQTIRMKGEERRKVAGELAELVALNGFGDLTRSYVEDFLGRGRPFATPRQGMEAMLKSVQMTPRQFLSVVRRIDGVKAGNVQQCRALLGERDRRVWHKEGKILSFDPFTKSVIDHARESLKKGERKNIAKCDPSVWAHTSINAAENSTPTLLRRATDIGPFQRKIEQIQFGAPVEIAEEDDRSPYYRRIPLQVKQPIVYEALKITFTELYFGLDHASKTFGRFLDAILAGNWKEAIAQFLMFVLSLLLSVVILFFKMGINFLGITLRNTVIFDEYSNLRILRPETYHEFEGFICLDLVYELSSHVTGSHWAPSLPTLATVVAQRIGSMNIPAGLRMSITDMTIDYLDLWKWYFTLKRNGRDPREDEGSRS